MIQEKPDICDYVNWQLVHLNQQLLLLKKKKKKAGLFSSHFCLSLFTKEKEGNKGGLGVAQTPGWRAQDGR